MPELPFVETDDIMIARMAAEHLIERGFNHYAFCGDERYKWSIWREEEFVRIVTEKGHACPVYRHHPEGGKAPSNMAEEERQLSAWVRQLPKPIGIMACYDLRGQQLLEVCRRIGIAVPDEVAVIGVDNDELLCNLSDPPLSSIIPDTHRTGYEAAQILDRLMSGKRCTTREVRVAPLGVVTRQSTDVLAIADSDISQAVRFIRQHACDGIKVEDVLEAVPLSRRVLENRFKKLLGRTPHDEILRMQFQRVVQLLTESSLPLTKVAEQAGFQHAEYLSVAFKRRFGVPPSRYRQEHHP